MESRKIKMELKKNVYGLMVLLLLFYKSIICYAFTIWFGNFSVKPRSHLQNVVRRARKITGMLPLTSLQEIFERSVKKQSLKTFTFIRRFYPKQLTVHSGYTFFNQYVFSLGIEPTTFCAANTMLYH